jgi:hypothetical protein
MPLADRDGCGAWVGRDCRARRGRPSGPSLPKNLTQSGIAKGKALEEKRLNSSLRS